MTLLEVCVIVADTLPDKRGHETGSSKLGERLVEILEIEQKTLDSSRNFWTFARVMLTGECYVSVNLVQKEIATIQKPDPLVIVVSSCAYLSAFTDEIVAYFKRSTTLHVSGMGENRHIVFLSKLFGVEVPWHYPIGIRRTLSRFFSYLRCFGRYFRFQV